MWEVALVILHSISVTLFPCNQDPTQDPMPLFQVQNPLLLYIWLVAVSVSSPSRKARKGVHSWHLMYAFYYTEVVHR